MTKIFIIYAEKQDIGTLIVTDASNKATVERRIDRVTDASDKTTAERKIDRIVAAGGSIHKVISGEELGLDVTVKSHLVYPDEV